jgi:hypothetical protein
LGSAIGQHHIVAQLPETKPPPFSLKDAFAEIKEAFSERAFLIFAAGGLAAYISQGMTFSISNYLNIYVWQLDRVSFDWGPAWLNGLTAYPFVLGLSVIGMFMIVGPMHHKLGKPASAAISALLALVIGLLPYGLFLAGFWPPIASLSSTLLYFGFTRCPDVCPTTLSRMAQLRKQLGTDGDKFRIVFVSVDPGYDSPEDIGRYVELFGTPILGLTGTDAEVDAAVKAYRAFYEKVPTNEGADYTIDHTASVYLMDADGRLQSIIAYDEADANALAKLKRLVG